MVRGTKVAHKTERQWYLPLIFLIIHCRVFLWNGLMPSVFLPCKTQIRYWLYHWCYQISPEPFNNFPKNLYRYSGSNSPSVNIDINPDTGVQVKNTTADISELPDLIASLYNPNIAPVVSADVAAEKLGNMIASMDISTTRKNELSSLLKTNTEDVFKMT